MTVGFMTALKIMTVGLTRAVGVMIFRTHDCCRRNDSQTYNHCRTYEFVSDLYISCIQQMHN
jgi:hypothetical protein